MAAGLQLLLLPAMGSFYFGKTPVLSISGMPNQLSPEGQIRKLDYYGRRQKPKLCSAQSKFLTVAGKKKKEKGTHINDHQASSKAANNCISPFVMMSLLSSFLSCNYKH